MESAGYIDEATVFHQVTEQLRGSYQFIGHLKLLTYLFVHHPHTNGKVMRNVIQKRENKFCQTLKTKQSVSTNFHFMDISTSIMYITSRQTTILTVNI